MSSDLWDKPRREGAVRKALVLEFLPETASSVIMFCIEKFCLIMWRAMRVDRIKGVGLHIVFDPAGAQHPLQYDARRLGESEGVIIWATKDVFRHGPDTQLREVINYRKENEVVQFKINISR